MANPNDPIERLEEKVRKAIELFKRTQAEKRALEHDLEKVRSDAKERAQGLSAMERELMALRHERVDVRGRIEKLLERIERLTSSEPGG